MKPQTLAPRLQDLRARIDAGVRAPWGAAAALAAGVAGAALGALLAEALLRALPLATGGLEAARSAGVWSQTSWAGYPKTAELLCLAVGLGVSGALGLLLACATACAFAARTPAAPSPPSQPSALARLRGWDWAVLALLFAFGAQPGPLAAPAAFYLLLAEEGAHLGAVTTLAHGGRLWEQLDYLYGPILLAPLLPAHALEPSAYGVRVATLLLHGLGLALLAAFARPLFRTRAGWIALALALAWLVPLPAPRLHLTAYRSALAFAPFLCLPRALSGGRCGWAGVGLGVAVALLTGSELLSAALLGPLVALLLLARSRTRALAELALGFAAGLLALAVLFLPIADPVGWLVSVRDKLGAVRLGYLSRVFPEPWNADRLWRGDPFGVGFDAAYFFWEGNAYVTVASACAVVALFRVLRAGSGARDALLLAFSLTALLLLPKLVSRPGVYQFAKVAPGILVGAVALAEDGLRALRTRRWDRAPLAVAGALGLLVLAGVTSLRAGPPSWPAAAPTLDARLGPIPLEPRFADFLAEVRRRVDRRLAPGEAVWSAPAAPGWNFALDRPPAHPLSISFVTTSHADRERLRERLAAHPPALILRHPTRSDFEGVPMRAFLGPAADFVDAHYEPVETLRYGPHVLELLAPRAAR